MELLHWQNLVFLIPLAVGLIFALGTAAGIGGDHDHDIDADHDLDLDHDIDIDADVAVDHDLDLDHDVEVGHDVDADHDLGGDHDADAEHDQEVDKSNPLDAVRKSHYRDPAWLKALGLIGVGKAPLTVVLTVLNLMFGGLGMAGNLTVGRSWFWLTFAVALVGAVLIGGRISNAVGKIVPKTETYCPGSNDLVGLFGTVIMTVDQRFGQVHVRDQYGNLHKVLCQATDGETIPKGQQVVLVSYDREKRRYLVAEAQLEQTA
jgi:hypothetical protein